MAITIHKKKKKQKYLIFVLLGVVVVTVVIVWYGFFKGEKAGVAPAVPAVAKKVKIDFEFLKGDKLGSLKPFEKILPIDLEETGRENPFLSY